MIKRTDRKVGRSKRHRRVRVNVSGTSERPRLAVFRSLNHLYAQVIDDGAAKTVAAASTVELKAKGNGMSEAAQVGKQIAAKAKGSPGKELAAMTAVASVLFNLDAALTR